MLLATTHVEDFEQFMKLSGILAFWTGAASRVGFKASGGIRTVAEAVTYFSLVADILGPQALGPARLRIGASSLLGDIEAVLNGEFVHSERAGRVGHGDLLRGRCERPRRSLAGAAGYGDELS